MINVLWFKRDLRLTDHDPLAWLCQQDVPVRLIYIFEPSLIADQHYSLRHWRFVYQSLQDMQCQLAEKMAEFSVDRLSKKSLRIEVFHAEAIEVFNHIARQGRIQTLVSYEETGLSITFERDRQVSAWCQAHGVVWKEFQRDAVIRGLPNRHHWDQAWKKVMKAPIVTPEWERLTVPPALETSNEILPKELSGFNGLSGFKELPNEWRETEPAFQTGGSTHAHRVLTDFFAGRGRTYHYQLSKPELSRVSCSRLSPYLAWGNISLRELYQHVLQYWQQPGWRKPLRALVSRLHWHCHFIQKFESECDMEHRPINRGYQQFPYRKDSCVEAHLLAWETGQTGYPMIDAAMRCVNATGYLNFRMRAMLVSFLCHHLLIDWRLGIKHLARAFLDFEPGIHYTQFQMQASVTGINTIRMYNPVKQGLDNDPNATFIAQWCPELATLPVELRHQPWQAKPMDAMFLGFEVGRDYPKPIVDLEEAGKWARDILWSWRKRPSVQKEAERILMRHVRQETA